VRILAIDDDESALSVIYSILGADGYTVLTAKSGRDGCTIAARDQMMDQSISRQRFPGTGDVASTEAAAVIGLP
jgi:CheY-like chemotaxis protein